MWVSLFGFPRDVELNVICVAVDVNVVFMEDVAKVEEVVASYNHTK